MNVGLLLNRATDLKWAGPFSEEALRRGHSIYLITLMNQKTHGKTYLDIEQKDCRPLIDLGAKFQQLDAEQLGESAASKSLDTLVMQEGFHSQKGLLKTFQQLREKGLHIYSLTHFFEICRRPLSALDHFDHTIYTSEYARKLHQSLQSDQPARANADDQLSLGSPMFDQLHKVSRDESRQALGLSTDERVVLLVAPVILPTTPWRFRVWRDASKATRLKEALQHGELAYLTEIALGYTFKDVFVAIRSFCDRNGAKLIVKSRGKQKNLDFASKEADIFLDGLQDEYYPLFSTYQLMAAADLCITVNSMAALEAASLGLPTINIYVPHQDRAAESTPQKVAYTRELLGGDPGSIMNYSGTVCKVDRRKAIVYFEQGWDAVCFEPKHTAEYARKFLGIESATSSSRILDLIEGSA